MNDLLTKYPLFQNAINNVIYLTSKNRKENEKMVILEFHQLMEEFHKIPPNTQFNSLLQYFKFKIPSLKEIDYEKLGFLNTKHRNIITIYNDIIKITHELELHYNLIHKDLNNPEKRRDFIRNNAITHINLDISIRNLISDLDKLIRENNLVREDFRLVTLPENTFKKTRFYLIPFLWMCRWFA